MCGIAGIFNYKSDVIPVDKTELLRMRERMINRGPDGAGLWIAEDQLVGLAHRRLAIIDLSEAAAQPMVDAETGNRIVFNGEIYNFRALRSELEVAGYRFHSHSDTEVLLKLYAAHGQEMLHKLRGMYAFGIWDARTRSLFLARDPFGIKPLYYADNGHTFRFASQVKALLAGGAVDTSPEPAGHVGFFIWGSVPEPYTLYKGVRNLQAGHWQRVTLQGASTPVGFDAVSQRLDKACETPQGMSKAGALRHIAEATRESILAHMVSDVPVGVFLSAGLDSAMIATTAAQAGTLRTITLGFDEYAGTSNDETPLAEKLAMALNADHTTVRITAEDFHADCDRLLDAMDQPSIDGVNTWFVAKAAAENGLKVVLSGLGGDELFASYPSFDEVPHMVRLLSGLARVPQLGRTLRLVSAPLIKRFTSPKYAGLLEFGGTMGGAYLLRRSLFMPWELPDIMEPEMAREGWNKLQTLPTLNRLTDGIDSDRLAVSALEMSCYMRNQLLRDADWAGMAHSLEIRVPLVDIKLITEAAGPFFFANPRFKKAQVVAAVAPTLPREYLSKAKTGFSIPVKVWQERKTSLRERGLRGWARYLYDVK